MGLFQSGSAGHLFVTEKQSGSGALTFPGGLGLVFLVSCYSGCSFLCVEKSTFFSVARRIWVRPLDPIRLGFFEILAHGTSSAVSAAPAQLHDPCKKLLARMLPTLPCSNVTSFLCELGARVLQHHGDRDVERPQGVVHGLPAAEPRHHGHAHTAGLLARADAPHARRRVRHQHR